MRVRHISILLSTVFVFVLVGLAADIPSPTSGKELYGAYCAACHGVTAKGNGPVAASLKAVPTDLTLLSQKNGGKYPEMHVIHAIEGESLVGAHGTKDMPVWGQRFRRSSGSSGEAQLMIKNLNDYIASLQAK